jgi:hypothetical protein
VYGVSARGDGGRAIWGFLKLGEGGQLEAGIANKAPRTAAVPAFLPFPSRASRAPGRRPAAA